MKELAFSELWYWFLLIAVVCYFVGCFNFAVIIAKTKHKDVHKIGSGNPGTMNMSREFGLKVGLLNFLLDVCKGGVPALVCYFIFRDCVFAGTALPPPPGMGYLGFTGGILVSDFIRYYCGLFVILGHIYPVTMKFKGGKGIASTLGLFWFSLSCETPWNILFAFLFLVFVVLLYIGLTEWGSMGSLLGVTGFSVWQGILFFLRWSPEGLLGNGWAIATFMLLLALNFFTWFAHRKNLVRLYAGEEHHTSIRKLKKGKRGMNNM